MTTAAEPAVDPPVVLRDVFPAEVALGDLVYRSARAVVTRDRLLVYVAAGRDRQLVLDEPYNAVESTVPAFNARPQVSTHLTLADGRQAHVNRQRGCGCGNPLKAWQPWQPYRVGTA